MLTPPKSILIVGGGTAGWMTANTLLHAWPLTKVTLIESADVGIIGVGEGGTPYLKEYFKKLNIEESEWMPKCDATYKVGINFVNWSGKPEYNSYFHPFYSVLDKPPAELFFHNCGLRRRGYEASCHPDDFFVAAELARQKKSPNLASASVDIDYAYHFDSAKLGHFLREKALSKGLVHIVDHVQSATLNERGEVAEVICENTGSYNAEFFIDCTGFAGLLINKTLKRSYQSYHEQLFNNAAVAIQTSNDGAIVTPQTESVALSNGWMWNIPLTTRQGNGYVYSDNHISADQAETELRLQLNIDDNADVTAKHLKMRVGRLNEHWYSNCLAVGLSQGFIEPLEATALMLTQLTVDKFIESFNQNSVQNKVCDQYNQTMNNAFDGIRDYIVAHYQLSNREDSAYWKDNKHNQNRPNVLSDILDAWESGQDVEKALNTHQSKLMYLRPSWYCILSGMGRFPTQLKQTQYSAKVEEAQHYCKKVVREKF